MMSAVDGAGKEHFHGCWRSGDGGAVDGECGDGKGMCISMVPGGQVML